MTADPLRYFRVEARELLEQLGHGVMELEKGPPPAGLVPRLLRHAHTLKGAARVVRQAPIADEAHALEELLGPRREDPSPVSRSLVDTLLSRLDVLAGLVGALERPAEEAPSAPAGAAGPLEEAVRVVRADVADVEAVVDDLGEAGAGLALLRRAVASAERLPHLADLLAENLSRRGPAGTSPARRARERIGPLAEELRDLALGLSRSLSTSLDRLERDLDQARDGAERLRLVPAREIFPTVERVVRDAARSLDRHAGLETRGGDVRLEGFVLGLVRDAIVQLVRNSVAHGLEPPAERERAGKPPEGRVRVEIERRGSRIRVLCADDGKGLDLGAVRKAAERSGRLSPNQTGSSGAAEVRAEDLVALLLKGGLSTATTVTQVSGRGVGLDVVRDAMARLGGEVRVESRPGRGTTVEMLVPVSRSALRVLEVESSGMVVALPLESVKGTLRLASGDVTLTAAGEGVVHGGKVLPFVPLSVALGFPARSRAAAASAVLVASGETTAVVGVERLRGTAGAVLRPLPALAAASPLLAGATLDREGNPRLVLDPEGLVRAASGPLGAPAPFVEAKPPRLLVVDDSLTTRILEQSILETAGYEVDLAMSAEEGLELARRNPYGLFLVDVEMPGMDGFEFVRSTRADPALREVPAILVTSRDTPEDRRRGLEAGAAGYTVKGEFDQTEFLEDVRRLVR